MSEWRNSLCQGLLIIHISPWSSIPDRTPFWKEIVYWWIKLMFTKVSLIREQPIGTSSFSSYPGETSCSSLFGLVYRLVSGITRLLHRKHNKPNCGEKECEISLWSTAPKCIQVKLDKHPHHSFLLPPRVMNNNETKSEYWQYSIYKNLYNITDNTEIK